MSAVAVNEFAKMRHLHVVLLVAVLFAVVTGIGLYAAVFNPDFDRTSASSWNTLLMLLPWLTELAGDRPKSEWMFPSPRKKGASIAEQYPNQALARAVALASVGREEKIPRHSAHALRHSFAAVSLSEAGADLLSASQAMGHARPSITLDKYGHLSKKGLTPLMGKIDAPVAPLTKPA